MHLLLRSNGYSAIANASTALAALSSKSVAALFAQATSQRHRDQLNLQLSALELAHNIQPLARWKPDDAQFKTALEKLVQRMVARCAENICLREGLEGVLGTRGCWGMWA